MTGELEDSLPLEDSEPTPPQTPPANGFHFDTPENDARERETVRRILRAGPVAVVILGTGHNLQLKIQAACPRCDFSLVAVDAI